MVGEDTNSGFRKLPGFGDTLRRYLRLGFFLVPLCSVLLILSGCKSTEAGGSLTEEAGRLYWNQGDPLEENLEPNMKLWFFDKASLVRTHKALEEQSLEIKIQHLKIKQARSSEALSRVTSLPNLFLGLDASDAKTEGQSVNQSWSASFSSSWELDLWGALASERREAGIRLSAGKIQLDALELSLLYQFLNAQIRFAGAIERSKLLQIQIEEQKEMEAQALDLFHSGRGTETAILLQRELKLGLEAGLPLIEESRRRALLDLSQLLRKPMVNLGSEFGVELPEKPSLPPAKNGSEWLDRRFDCRLAWLTVLESEESWLQAKARRLPTLTLQAQLGFSGQHPGEVFDTWLRQLSASLLSPIFDGGRRRLEAVLAGDVVQQRLLELRQRAEISYGELEGLRLSWETQHEAWRGRLLQLDASKKSLESLTDRYQLGEVTLMEVLQQRSRMRSLEMQVLNHRIQAFELQAMWAKAQAIFPVSSPTHQSDKLNSQTSPSEF
jgi:outer membrane protein TolC